MNTITPEELAKQRHDNVDVLVVDVLTRKMFRKQHLPGSVSVPMDQIQELIPRIAEKDRNIVVYCYDIDCQASPKAAEMLKLLGYTNIADMEVGIEGWKKAGFPVAHLDVADA